MLIDIYFDTTFTQKIHIQWISIGLIVTVRGLCRYHLERKIFQHLLDLKRLQIRSGQHNEAMLVKRAIDAYHKSCAATVGSGRYVPQDFTFRSFEYFLYNSLRKIQLNGFDHLKGLPETPKNPLQCTQSTHRCDHAVHAYTGIPCAAYRKCSSRFKLSFSKTHFILLFIFTFITQIFDFTNGIMRSGWVLVLPNLKIEYELDAVKYSIRSIRMPDSEVFDS